MKSTFSAWNVDKAAHGKESLVRYRSWEKTATEAMEGDLKATRAATLDAAVAGTPFEKARPPNGVLAEAKEFVEKLEKGLIVDLERAATAVVKPTGRGRGAAMVARETTAKEKAVTDLAEAKDREPKAKEIVACHKLWVDYGVIAMQKYKDLAQDKDLKRLEHKTVFELAHAGPDPSRRRERTPEKEKEANSKEEGGGANDKDDDPEGGKKSPKKQRGLAIEGMSWVNSASAMHLCRLMGISDSRLRTISVAPGGGSRCDVFTALILLADKEPSDLVSSEIKVARLSSDEAKKFERACAFLGKNPEGLWSLFDVLYERAMAEGRRTPSEAELRIFVGGDASLVLRGQDLVAASVAWVQAWESIARAVKDIETELREMVALSSWPVVQEALQEKRKAVKLQKIHPGAELSAVPGRDGLKCRVLAARHSLALAAAAGEEPYVAGAIAGLQPGAAGAKGGTGVVGAGASGNTNFEKAMDKKMDTMMSKVSAFMQSGGGGGGGGGGGSVMSPTRSTGASTGGGGANGGAYVPTPGKIGWARHAAAEELGFAGKGAGAGACFFCGAKDAERHNIGDCPKASDAEKKKFFELVDVKKMEKKSA